MASHPPFLQTYQQWLDVNYPHLAPVAPPPLPAPVMVEMTILDHFWESRIVKTFVGQGWRVTMYRYASAEQRQAYIRTWFPAPV